MHKINESTSVNRVLGIYLYNVHTACMNLPRIRVFYNQNAKPNSIIQPRHTRYYEIMLPIL
jgi:hypothetical protein